MSEPLSDDYLEGMRAHVENGGTFYHRNGLDLLVEVDRLRSALATAEAAALERAAKVAREVAAAHRRMHREAADVGGLFETAGRQEAAADACEKLAHRILKLIPAGHSPAAAGEAGVERLTASAIEAAQKFVEFYDRVPDDGATSEDAHWTTRLLDELRIALAALASSLAQKEPQP